MEFTYNPDFLLGFSKVVTKTPGCIDQESNIIYLSGWKDVYSVYVPDHVATSFGFKTFAVEFNIEKAAGRNVWLIPVGELGRCLGSTRSYPVVGGASGRYEHLGHKPYTHEEEAMPRGAEAYYRSIAGIQ